MDLLQGLGLCRFCQNHFLRNVSWRVVASSFSTTSATLDFRQPSSSRGFGAVYRLKRGQAINKTRYGPLTDLPDFTFLDGRPTPLAPGQKRRLDEKKQMTTVIMKMLQEIDTAETYFKEKQMEEKEQRDKILSKQFKPKSS
ncbi:hypothetical protein CHS0354_032380 [Potamilus streckersoni]|uniref:Large ribosomal subunit protein mL52 n=1 Tax=Potamilus streckersoni TaxID=2493646 RepID=A0AAE0TGY4_9BIVA|nr:hypothetical protein CHS0354_032380 [Potamilus streckersoni]